MRFVASPSDYFNKLKNADYVLYLLPSVSRSIISILLLVPIITYYLEPEDIGLFALITAIVLPVKALASSGAQWVIGGNYHQIGIEQRGVMLFNILLFEVVLRTIFIGLYIVIIEPVMGLFFEGETAHYKDYFLVALLATWFNLLWSTVSFLMIVQRDALSYMVVSVIQIIIQAIVTIFCLAYMGWGVESLFFAYLIVNFVSLLCEIYYVYNYLSVKISKRWVGEITKNGFRSIPGGFAEMVSNMVDKLAIQYWVNIGTLGFYSHSQQYQSIFKMFATSFKNTVSPISLEIYSKKQDEKKFTNILSLWYGCLCLVGVFVALFSDDVISILTHGKFVESAPFVLVWYLLIYSISFGIPYTQYLIANKHSRVLMYTQAIPTIIGIGLIVGLTYLFGAMGAVWAAVIAHMIIQMTRFIIAYRLGCKSIASKPFVFSVMTYVVVCLTDYQWGLEWKIELPLVLILSCIAIWKFRMLQNIKKILILT
ncbi:hypothetical protein AB835_08660 [Candidatus Endobugula sertula]|uniref:Polysaccharide biosynthesis protein C-terminal domain-containing protein n=1 Tax=Candidatus Endobugula sertula TaxID=62101 RepID=A0A1D2QPH5_9GAMM|nr:hypothetical protein AB835_08660 [Candidatus Endobugula sertula]